MKVEIDSNSGFCFGVVRAISLAEEALQRDGSQIYSLGDIVHNRKEVQRLEEMGLRRATHEDMEQMEEQITSRLISLCHMFSTAILIPASSATGRSMR